MDLAACTCNLDMKMTMNMVNIMMMRMMRMLMMLIYVDTGGDYDDAYFVGFFLSHIQMSKT